jgi:hypothetical protein
MRFLCASLLAMTTLLTLSPAASAGLVLSLSAPSADLNHLAVGQTVTFDVSLSGLNAGDELDYLAGTVTFDSALLGTASSVNASAIVPDLTGFVGTGFAGAADAFYDAVFVAVTSTPISSNGVFYTFDVVAQQPGSGSLAFDVSSLAATDGTNTPVPLDAGPALPFTIEGGNAVPEPSSLVVALAALGCTGGAAVSRRRLRHRLERH